MMTPTDQGEDEVLILLEPSAGRRTAALVIFLALGAMLIWMGLATTPAPGWAIVLVAGGVLSLFFGVRLWQIGQVSLELTRSELREKGGRLVALVADVRGVERGAFAFKPSNGFLIRLNSAQSRAYVPGIWWRMGRRVGVGGMANAGQAKAMADILAAMISEDA